MKGNYKRNTDPSVQLQDRVVSVYQLKKLDIKVMYHLRLSCFFFTFPHIAFVFWRFQPEVVAKPLPINNKQSRKRISKKAKNKQNQKRESGGKRMIAKANVYSCSVALRQRTRSTDCAAFMSNVCQDKTCSRAKNKCANNAQRDVCLGITTGRHQNENTQIRSNKACPSILDL